MYTNTANMFQPHTTTQLRDAVDNYYHRGDRSYGPIGTWDTSKITDMSLLFFNMTEFNESIADWNTSSVTNMINMFRGCTSFNQPLHTWNTSSVTDMSGMFACCTSFNQPLHTWDTSSVTNMERMFYGCTSFVQPMGNWQAPVTVFAGCPDPEYCCKVVNDHYCVK